MDLIKSTTMITISPFDSSNLRVFFHAAQSLSQPSLITPKFSSALSNLSLAVVVAASIVTTATSSSSSSFVAIADFDPTSTTATITSDYSRFSWDCRRPSFSCLGRPRIVAVAAAATTAASSYSD